MVRVEVFATLIYFTLSTISTDDMIEMGKLQYQLLQERGNLPQYGSCWKKALEHIHEGCNTLSEETQSEIALHLANCFLDMSGHETYTCENDKKRNLRGICINSMSDRAFNVYTEFYTHAQNICWFLRGQIWHETIAESTFRVGLQLEVAARNQEALLEVQRQSLDMQEKILSHGFVLERIVGEVVGSHEKILALQNWLVREMSWFGTIVFYGVSVVFVLVSTAVKVTRSARLPIFALVFLCSFVERAIYSYLPQFVIDADVNSVHVRCLFYVWIVRYIFIALSLIILILAISLYKDYNKLNNLWLQKIYTQNSHILDLLKKLSPCSSEVSILVEEKVQQTETEQSKFHISTNSLLQENKNLSCTNGENKSRHKTPPVLLENGGTKYNLRSRTATPDIISGR